MLQTLKQPKSDDPFAASLSEDELARMRNLAKKLSKQIGEGKLKTSDDAGPHKTVSGLGSSREGSRQGVEHSVKHRPKQSPQSPQSPQINGSISTRTSAKARSERRNSCTYSHDDNTRDSCNSQLRKKKKKKRKDASKFWLLWLILLSFIDE